MIKHYIGKLGEFDYNTTEYAVKEDIGGNEYLNYIGIGENVRLPSGCISCYRMFFDYPFPKLDLSEFDISEVISMKQMFKSAKRLEQINVSSFDTSKVQTMSYMFQDCTCLEYVDLSNFDTRNLTIVSYMFSGCKSLRGIQFSHNFFKEVFVAESMFFNCRQLQEIDLSSFEKNRGVVNLNKMFEFCISLKTIDMSYIDRQSIYDSDFMFERCDLLESVSLAGKDYSSEIQISNIARVFGRVLSLKYLELNRDAKILLEDDIELGKLKMYRSDSYDKTL